MIQGSHTKNEMSQTNVMIMNYFSHYGRCIVWGSKVRPFRTKFLDIKIIYWVFCWYDERYRLQYYSKRPWNWRLCGETDEGNHRRNWRVDWVLDGTIPSNRVQIWYWIQAYDWITWKSKWQECKEKTSTNQGVIKA